MAGADRGVALGTRRVPGPGPSALDREATGGAPGGVTALLVVDHLLLAHMLAVALGQAGVGCSVALTHEAGELVEEVLVVRPDLVLLDLDLEPGAGSGLALIRPIVAAGCRVVVVTGSNDDEHLAEALRLGVVGVVGRDLALDDLLRAVTAAARGDRVMTDHQRAELECRGRRARATRVRGHAPFERLTRREAEVLREIAAGRSVAAVAARACLSEATVRSQVRGVFTKLGVTSQVEAVAVAYRSGWIDGQDRSPGARIRSTPPATDQ